MQFYTVFPSPTGCLCDRPPLSSSPWLTSVGNAWSLLLHLSDREREQAAGHVSRTWKCSIEHHLFINFLKLNIPVFLNATSPVRVQEKKNVVLQTILSMHLFSPLYRRNTPKFHCQPPHCTVWYIWRIPHYGQPIPNWQVTGGALRSK